jgi:nitrite reductase/ring-hydroxylating ferredoxin subunit
MPEVRIGRLQDLPEKQAVLVQIGDRVVGVFKVNGRVHAWENRCAHAGGPVCQGEVLGRFEHILGPDMTVIGERFRDDEYHLVCPWHGWEFNIETGVCTTDPKYRLRRYPVEVRGDEVYLLA